MNRYLRSHIANALDKYTPILQGGNLHSQPLDRHMKDYLLANKSINAGDRRAIQSSAYDLVRHKTLLDEISVKPLSWITRLESLQNKELFSKQQENPEIPAHIRASLPADIFQILSTSYGPDKAIEYGKVMNERAPVTLRVNPHKINREDLFKRMKGKYKMMVRKCEDSPLGIVMMSMADVNLQSMQEYKTGCFEIQDEGSQLAGLRVTPQKHQSVLDYCSGAGGKTLVFGPTLLGTGQLYLHDPRKSALS